MLERLLRILASGSAYTYRELAQKLGVDEAMLEEMLEGLARLGYLSPMAMSCEGGCHACAERGACLARGICAMGEKGNIWVLTEKGSRAAARQA